MSDLTEAELIGLFKGGATKTSISKTLGFPRTTVIQTIQNFLKRKSLANQPRSGRPKLLKLEHRQTLKCIVKNLFNERTGLDVSTRTIRRIYTSLNFLSHSNIQTFN
jgi:transposase